MRTTSPSAVSLQQASRAGKHRLRCWPGQRSWGCGAACRNCCAQRSARCRTLCRRVLHCRSRPCCTERLPLRAGSGRKRAASEALDEEPAGNEEPAAPYQAPAPAAYQPSFAEAAGQPLRDILERAQPQGITHSDDAAVVVGQPCVRQLMDRCSRAARHALTAQSDQHGAASGYAVHLRWGGCTCEPMQRPPRLRCRARKVHAGPSA